MGERKYSPSETYGGISLKPHTLGLHMVFVPREVRLHTFTRSHTLKQRARSAVTLAISSRVNV